MGCVANDASHAQREAENFKLWVGNDAPPPTPTTAVFLSFQWTCPNYYMSPLPFVAEMIPQIFMTPIAT